jgi:hypothetical protein
MMRRLGVLALLLALGASVSACAVTGSVDAQRTDSKSLIVDLAPVVVVDTFNGRISVTAGVDGVVEARVTSRGSGTSQADAEADLAKVQVTFDHSFGKFEQVTITARRTDQPLTLGNSGADIEVSVPAASSLQLRTSNGRIEAANVLGSILARTSNGAITTRGGTDLDLDTSNGPLSVNNASGPLRLRTSNGPLDVLGARDALVSATTSNAGLSFNGALRPGSHVFETSNGDLSLTLPGDSWFSLDGHTSNGSVRTDFPLDVSATSITGTAGSSPRPSPGPSGSPGPSLGPGASGLVAASATVSPPAAAPSPAGSSSASPSASPATSSSAAKAPTLINAVTSNGDLSVMQQNP